MKRKAALLAAALALFVGAAEAADYSAGDIQIGNPWARATPRGAQVAAGYFTLTNNGSAPDRLVGGSTPVAARVEIPSIVAEDGVAKMRPIEGGLATNRGERVELRPGSLHAMLTGLTHPLQSGRRVPGPLVSEQAGTVPIEFTVVPPGQEAPAGPHHSGH